MADGLVRCKMNSTGIRLQSRVNFAVPFEVLRNSNSNTSWIFFPLSTCSGEMFHSSNGIRKTLVSSFPGQRMPVIYYLTGVLFQIHCSWSKLNDVLRRIVSCFKFQRDVRNCIITPRNRNFAPRYSIAFVLLGTRRNIYNLSKKWVFNRINRTARQCKRWNWKCTYWRIINSRNN